jgi:hypothetical protein
LAKNSSTDERKNLPKISTAAKTFLWYERENSSKVDTFQNVSRTLNGGQSPICMYLNNPKRSCHSFSKLAGSKQLFSPELKVQLDNRNVFALHFVLLDFCLQIVVFAVVSLVDLLEKKASKTCVDEMPKLLRVRVVT